MANTTKQTELQFDERFLEQYVGKKLISDPVTAIVELVANAWDAAATEVRIEWPIELGHALRVVDNGQGMTQEEFERRWSTLSYNRHREQGDSVTVTKAGATKSRAVFGRNGIGRFAAFCFGKEYRVSSSKAGTRCSFSVKRGITKPVDITLLSKTNDKVPGTIIEVQSEAFLNLKPALIAAELGMRFLTDPWFQVRVNGELIEFEHIEEHGLVRIPVQVPGVEGKITILFIDTQRADRTMRQHGVAWHVLGRLVGECAWVDPEQKSLIDGRRVEAKRYTFIVQADMLNEIGAVKADWSGFNEDHPEFKKVNEHVQGIITAKLREATRERRRETSRIIRETFSTEVRQLAPLSRERWTSFVDKMQEECPGLSENELKSVAGLLAKMELSESRYALLHKLHAYMPGQLDGLNEVLDKWTLEMAKVVLDELEMRLRLVDELQLRTENDKTLEVQQLQPLFHRGLWIFGPEFETIEYTSNRGMTTVIRELFGRKDIKGSLNRPDFVIIPDGSVGLYSYDEYSEEDGGEVGPAKIVVVELKAPDVPIGDEEKNQSWKYVRELNAKGLMTARTTVRCFVLGKSINPLDRGKKTELDGRVEIIPMDYNTVLRRAKSRLLNLHERIKSAPFLQEQRIDAYLNADPSPEVLNLDATGATGADAKSPVAVLD